MMDQHHILKTSPVSEMEEQWKAYLEPDIAVDDDLVVCQGLERPHDDLLHHRLVALHARCHHPIADLLRKLVVGHLLKLLMAQSDPAFKHSANTNHSAPCRNSYKARWACGRSYGQTTVTSAMNPHIFGAQYWTLVHCHGCRTLTLASSSLAAWIQMAISEGRALRASLRILRAFSYDSRRASASHSSTCCRGQQG